MLYSIEARGTAFWFPWNVFVTLSRTGKHLRNRFVRLCGAFYEAVTVMTAPHVTMQPVEFEFSEPILAEPGDEELGPDRFSERSLELVSEAARVKQVSNHIEVC